MLILELIGIWVLLGAVTVAVFGQALKFGRRNDPTYN